MKNKIISSLAALGLATSLNATSFFTTERDNNYIEFHNDIIKFFNNDSFFTTPYKTYSMNYSSSYPKMNAFENDKNYTFKFELSGIDKKNIKVTITDQNILTIIGKKQELSKEEKNNMIRQEHYYGSFSRSISLPDDIDTNKIKVKHDNGVLNVIVNKDTKKIKKGVRTLAID